MERAGCNLAVVGATELLGSEIVRVLTERSFPFVELRCFDSGAGVGERIEPEGPSAMVELLDRADFDGIDIAFFASSETVTAQWAKRAIEAGAIAVDASQLHAADPAVPLIVPEVNAPALEGLGAVRLIASPTASARQLAVALKPLRDLAGLKRVVVSSYQPVSEAGQVGIEALSRQTVDLLNGRSPEIALFSQRIAFNLLPQVGEFLEGGVSRAELQLVEQVRRLLEDATLAITATEVRVPIFFGIGQSISVETEQFLSAERAREALREAPGVLLQDDPTENEYPTPMTCIGTDAICVGRVRQDLSVPAGLSLWSSADNLRTGGALNLVAIAEILMRDRL
jgi:aspartate-semialdehyde dehydrogenase